VVDEAYIDFRLEEEREEGEGGLPSLGFVGEGKSSALELLRSEGWENLVILQTMSKGFGLAGIRLGVSFQSAGLTQILNNTKAPYSISVPTAHLAMLALSPPSHIKYRQNLRTLISNRSFLLNEFKHGWSELGLGEVIGGNHANFIMVPILGKGGSSANERAHKLYKLLAETIPVRIEGEQTGKKVVVRFRGTEIGCDGCLRVTVGTREECEEVVRRFREGLGMV